MLAEVAPLLVPQFDALLIGLLLLAGFIVAAGIIYTLHGFVRATVGGIAGLVSKIPGVGSIIASPVNAVYHWMNAEFSAVEAGLDRRISSYFHQLAKLISWVGDEIAAHANLLWTLSTIVLGSGLTDVLRNGVRLIGREIHAVRGQLDALRRELVKPIQGEVKALERWTYPRVRALTHAIDVTLPRELAGLRGRTQTVERDLSRAWDAIRRHEVALGVTALTGVVAVALSRLGLGFLRCDSARNVGNKIGCGGFSSIDNLLGDGLGGLLGALLTVEAVVNLREIVKVAQTVERGVATGLKDVLEL